MMSSTTPPLDPSHVTTMPEPHENPAANHGHAHLGRLATAGLALGALGVVYGDIGTSPLYAIRECFGGEHGVDPSRLNVLGILSLFFWTLALVVCIKYLTFVMRADNHGEGGILALLALAIPNDTAGRRTPLLRGIVISIG